MRILFILFRLAGAAAITAAIVGQYIHSLNFRALNGIDENGVQLHRHQILRGDGPGRLPQLPAGRLRSLP